MLKFQGGYLAQTAYVAFSPAELACEKRLNEIPGDGGPNGAAAHTNDVHVVMLNPLLSRKVVVDQPGTYAWDLVGTHRSADPTTANRDTARYFARGHGLREWNYYVGIVVQRVQLMSTEIDYFMPRCT